MIARHVHDMLVCCHEMKRYFAPTIRQVVKESLAVYAWVAFLAAWPFVEFLPHRLRLSAGLACLPHEYDTTSTIFFWLVFMPLFCLLPTAYALYVAFDVWRRQLLPTEKTKKRNIAIYFFRLTVVFLIMWVPSIFLMFIAGGYTSSWVAFAGGCWSHLQGAVSAVASIMKADIGQAFAQFITCGRARTNALVSSSHLRVWSSRLSSRRTSSRQNNEPEVSSPLPVVVSDADTDVGCKSVMDDESPIDDDNISNHGNRHKDDIIAGSSLNEKGIVLQQQ